ncbi:MAG: hypothetical protein WB774_15890, partial [Xanthobacteraceae bacterium]
KQAGHMTAPDQCCSNVRKFLPRRRPHMTHSGHRTRRLPSEIPGQFTTQSSVGSDSLKSCKENCFPDSRVMFGKKAKPQPFRDLAEIIPVAPAA